MEKDFDELLVSAVEPYPWLYNLKRPDYRNADKRQSSWEKIGKKLNKTSEECNKRWKQLRERFAREKQYSTRYKKKGTEDGEYKEWHLMDKMSYLRSCIRRYKNPRIKKPTTSAEELPKDKFAFNIIKQELDDAQDSSSPPVVSCVTPSPSPQPTSSEQSPDSPFPSPATYLSIFRSSFISRASAVSSSTEVVTTANSSLNTLPVISTVWSVPPCVLVSKPLDSIDPPSIMPEKILDSNESVIPPSKLLKDLKPIKVSTNEHFGSLIASQLDELPKNQQIAARVHLMKCFHDFISYTQQ